MYDPEKLKHDVAVAMDINPDYPPMLLVTPAGAVRRMLTAFGDPLPGWPEKLAEAGISAAAAPWASTAGRRWRRARRRCSRGGA